MIKSLFKKGFNTLGYDVRRSDMLPNPEPKYGADLWKFDPLFQELWAQARQFTLLPELDAYTIYQLITPAVRLKGDIAEIGVYRGGTASILGHFADATGKQLHLFDTFAGMPETDSVKDWHKKGDFSDTSLDQVRRNLSSVRNVNFYPGFFPATAGPVKDAIFCFVHVDVDIYQSVKDCCDFYYPKLQAGGVMLFDDYGKFTCPGALKAVDEFFADKPEKRFYLPSGPSFVIKQPCSSAGQEKNH
jgi:O-methyltransferase